MKNLSILLLLVATTLIYFSSCKKAMPPGTDDRLIQAAQSYFQQQWQNAPSAAPNPNPRNTGARTPDWSKARVLLLPMATAVIVPVHYNRPFYLGSNFGGIRQYFADDLTQLIIYKDSAKNFHAEMVTAVPDSNYKELQDHPFTGMILVDQWNGHPLARYKYNDQRPRVWYPDHLSQRQVIPDDLVIETCYEVGL